MLTAMTLAELIEEGWKRHEQQTEEVARKLEAGLELIAPGDPEGAAAFLHLVNHTIGDHGADRARALKVCEAAFGRLTEWGQKSPWLHLAVARHLAGEEEAAREAENELGEHAVSQVRVRLLVAQSKSHEGDWEGVAKLHEECLHVADSLAEGHAAERVVAIVSNNIASALVELEQRSALEEALMERCAVSAREYWLRVGDWTHDERADYLLALVHNALGRPGEAREFARRGLKTIATNGEEKVDQAFLELAQARSCRLLGDEEGRQMAILRAQALSDEFEDEGLMGWFERTLAKVK